MAFNFNGNTPKRILYNGLNVAKLVYNGVVVWMSKVLATISGILPITLTDCTGDDLVDYKIYGNSEYEGLPDGYTQVEYLESTGTQYINTGVNLSNNSNIEINAKLTATQRNKTYYLFGSSIENNRYMIAVGSFTNKYLADFVSNSYRIESSVSAFDGKFHTHKVTNLSYYIDEILQGSKSSSTFTNTSSAYIFDVRDRGTSSTLGTQSWKIKYCKIWDGDNLIRNFIPCTNSSNVAGLYDTVNGVFYTNAGTGTFNVGSVVSKKSVGDLVTDTSDINYGKYKIPVLTNSHTTNIYLNKPLRRASKLIAGAEVETVYYTDYLDYENQKVVRNVDDNDKEIDTPVEESVVLPAVPTDEGTVTVDVDTEIAPSYAEIKYYKNGS